MGIRKWLPLMGISIGVFIFNMSEFMPIGLLTGISSDLGVSESSAGLIISVYAWAVALLSLPIMLLLRKMEYRRMLLLCVLLFTVFQALSGLSSDYWMLMASRIGVAVAHSIFWSIATPLAVRVVEPRLTKLAIGAVATGTSIAMIVGLPLGRVIGLALGWRASFLTMAVMSLAVLVMLIAVFPRIENPGTFTLKRVPEIFRNRIVVTIYVVVAVSVTGYYTGYSYIEPFLGEIAGLSDTMITVALTVFGLAGILGSILFNRIYGTTRFPYIIGSIGMSGVVLLTIRFMASGQGTSLIACAAWGLFVTSFNVCLQHEIMRASPIDAVAIIMSLFSGIYNVGIAMGSIIGGVVTDTVGVGDIGFVAGAFLLAGAAISAFVLVPGLKAHDRDRRNTAS